MSDADNKQIRMGILGYEAVLNFYRLNTHVGKTVTIDDAYNALRNNENIKAKLQVREAVKKWFAAGKLSRIRIGQPYAYWYKDNPLPDALQPKQLPQPEVRLRSPIPKPEIHVSANQIVINHAKCRITIDFDEDYDGPTVTS